MQSSNRHIGYLTAGTLEVKGDFTQARTYNVGSTCNFAAKGSNRVLLSGSGAQTISFANPGTSYFNILEIKRKSGDGLSFPNPICVTKLISNGCALPSIIVNVMVWKLCEDEVINGDMNISGSKLDLNGYTLKVTGNVMQTGGTANIDGGSLWISGDYTLQNNSNLVMTNGNDYVLVNGNFNTCTYSNETGYLSAGELEVYGDFFQSGGAYSFAASGNNLVILDGDDTQSVSMNSSSSAFAILDCTDSVGIIFKTPITVKSNLYGIDNIINDDVVTLINSNITLDYDMELGTSLKLVNTNVNLNGYRLKIYGDLNQIGGNIDQTKGTLDVTGKYTLNGVNMFPEEVVRNFVLGMFYSLVNNELDNLNFIQTALNSFFGSDYAAYQFKILEEYKSGGLEEIESKVTLKKPYYAGKVVTDAAFFTGGLLALGDCIELFSSGVTGIVASGILEIGSGGTLTPAVAVAATASAVAVVGSLVGAAEFAKLAYNAGKNGVNDTSDLIKAINDDGTNGANKAALDDGLGTYGSQGGHHPMAKRAFEGVSGYDYKEALTISQSKLAEFDVKHSTITGQQKILYSQFSKTGKQLTIDAMKQIEIKAMTNSGVPLNYAENAVNKAIDALQKAGITQPSRIPWGK